MSDEKSIAKLPSNQVARSGNSSEFLPLSIARGESHRLNDLGADISEGHTQAQVHLAASLVAAIVTGERLLEVKALLPRGRFLKWIDAELTPACNLSRRSAQRYMQLSNRREELVARIRRDYSTEPGNELTLEEAEGVLSTLRMKDAHSLLPAKKQGPPITPKNRKPSTPTVPSVSELPVPSSVNTEEVFTPVDIIAATKTFLGQIDLDPCAETSDQPNVPATQRYTRLENGLNFANAWHGQVFLHPPNDGTTRDWITRAINEHATEAINEAVLLLPDNGGSEWLQLLDAYPRVYLRARTKPVLPHPSFVVGLIESHRLADFASAFSKIGAIFVPYLFTLED